jgi:hypothetical protein
MGAFSESGYSATGLSPHRQERSSGGGANSDWQSWARDIQKTVLQIRAAAKVKAQDKFTAAADQLSEACQNCSAKDRAEAPSDGLARYPFYPKRGLAK